MKFLWMFLLAFGVQAADPYIIKITTGYFDYTQIDPTTGAVKYNQPVISEIPLGWTWTVDAANSLSFIDIVHTTGKFPLLIQDYSAQGTFLALLPVFIFIPDASKTTAFNIFCNSNASSPIDHIFYVYFDLGGCQGNAGPAGPAGAQGPQGDIGPAGSTGSQGVAGPKGDKGDIGSMGPAGNDAISLGLIILPASQSAPVGYQLVGSTTLKLKFGKKNVKVNINLFSK